MRIDAPSITGSFVVNNATLPDISGLATVSGNTFTGNQVINGTIVATGTTLVSGSAQVSYTGITNIPSGIVSSSAQTIANLPSGVVSGSVQTIANLPSGVVSGSAQVTTFGFGTTGSNTFQGSQTVNGSLVVTGSLTAQQFIVSSSVTYLTESFASGSHKFGDSSDDYHDFTGSVRITGSINVTGSLLTTGSSVGIGGQANPARTLHVMGQGAFDMTHAGVVIQESISPMTSSQIVSYKQTNAVGSAYRNMHLRADVLGVAIMSGSGYVSIGKDTANSMLDVNGNTLVSGSLTTTGDLTVNSNGAIFNRTSSGEPYLFFRKDGVNRGSIYGITGGGLRMFDQSDNQVFTMTGSMIGIGVTSPASKLHVGGNIKYSGRIFSSAAIVGNIYTNLTGAAAPSYILVCDLNETAGWSLVGHCNAASYTCWNISQIYIQKNYSSTAASAGITGLYKSGCNMTIVDLSYGGGRYIAIGYTSNPEIDVVWTGFNLTSQFTADGQATVVAGASVTVNSTLATY